MVFRKKTGKSMSCIVRGGRRIWKARTKESDKIGGEQMATS